MIIRFMYVLSRLVTQAEELGGPAPGLSRRS